MFNDHFIRGLKKMELMLSLTFVVMLTMAKGHIKNKQKNIRSLVAQKMIMNQKICKFAIGILCPFYLEKNVNCKIPQKCIDIS